MSGELFRDSCIGGFVLIVLILFYFIEVADISHALSKLTEPAPVPIHKLSVTNMVHSAKKKIRKHRGVDESPLNNEVLNTILLVSEVSMPVKCI